MKKIFYFCSVFFFLFFFCHNISAQQPSLSNAFYYSSGIVMDSKGNAFVTGKNNMVVKITPEGKPELFAGDRSKNGKGRTSWLSDGGIAIDSEDNLYVTDGTQIRKIASNGSMSTIAGSSNRDSKDGYRANAAFVHLENIAIDNKGTLYVTDYAPTKDGIYGRGNSGQYVIRKITPEGIVTTIKNEMGDNLFLWYPRGLACDKDGNLYVCASVSHCIKKITPGGIITSIAGQCDVKKFNSVYKEGNISTAVLTDPTGIAISKNGDIYISDSRLHRIIKIDKNKVTTVAGIGKINFSANPAGYAEEGYVDGNSKNALFNFPAGIAFDGSGNLYIIDASSKNNSYIRKLSPNGIVTTFSKQFFNKVTQQYE